MVNFKEIFHFSRFQGGGGVQLFPEGVQLLIPYTNPYNLWFSRGGGGSGPPVPPSGSALANKWIQVLLCLDIGPDKQNFEHKIENDSMRSKNEPSPIDGHQQHVHKKTNFQL